MEMFKNPFTWLLIVLILGTALIGGLDHKKTTAESEVHNGQSIIDLYK